MHLRSSERSIPRDVGDQSSSPVAMNALEERLAHRLEAGLRPPRTKQKPSTYSRTKQKPNQKEAVPGSNHKMTMLTLEFVSRETESMYTADLWSRESWQFAITNAAMSHLTLLLLLVPYLKLGAIRPFVLWVSGVFCVVSTLVVFLLHSKPRLFDRIRCTVQVAFMLASIALPTPTLFHAYVFPCHENEQAASLLQCKLLQISMVPYETVLYTLFTPLVLSYMNVRFRHLFLVCTASFIQLMAIAFHVGQSPDRLAEQSVLRPLPLLFFFPWLFMLLSVWNYERKDREGYVLRKTIERTHAQELRVAQLESKAAAEETLLSFLCHEIRNPYNGLLGYTELTHATTSTLLERANKEASSSIDGKVESPELLHGLDQIKGWCASVLSSSNHMLGEWVPSVASVDMF
jgi:hypothetical protein